MDRDALRGRVAVVAGATRGAGRGIAAALGEAGATVICTGRTTRAEGSSRSDYDRPETIEETAELVTSLGGTGVAMAVDHLDADEVRVLAERIARERGRTSRRRTGGRSGPRTVEPAIAHRGAAGTRVRLHRRRRDAVRLLVVDGVTARFPA